MKTSTIKNIIKHSVAALFTGAAISAHAAAPVPVTMCAFTMMGANGPEQQALLDYQAAALNWGVKLTLKPYMNEKVVVNEFKAGVCDLANMTSMQARDFNKFTGTLDAPAAMPTYKHLKIVMEALAQPSADKYMKVGNYEIVGIQPAGAVYLFSDDRKVQSLQDLAGKRMAILDSMPEVRQLVTDLGMTPVSSTVTNIFQKFNNHAVDICGGPAIVYDMMELHKGLEPNGGILHEPIMQGNMQFVARYAKLPPGFGEKSRQYFVQHFDSGLKLIRTAEQNIPKKWWIPLPPNQRDEFNLQTRKIRERFAKDGIYDKRMLVLLHRVRCKLDPTLAECSEANAE